MMSAESKILAVMEFIKGKVKLAPIAGNGRFIFNPYDVIIDGLTDSDILAVMEDLLKSNLIIVPEDEAEFSYVIGKSFNKYYEALKKHTKLERETRKAPLLWFSYKNDKIFINDILFIHKTHYDSFNARVLEYLKSHSNMIVTREEMAKSNIFKDKEDKDFFTFLSDIKMNGWLRELFFPKHISKDTLYFRDAIYQEDIDSGDVKIVDIGSIIPINKKTNKSKTP